MTKLLQQCFLFFIVVVILGLNLGNSQVSVYMTIGPTLVSFSPTDSFGTALGAVYAVKVTYTDVQTPVLTIKEAVAKQSFFPKPCDDLVVGNPEGK